MYTLAGHITDPKLRANGRNSLIDGMWYCVMVGLTQPFVGVYAIKLGASDYLVGLLSSLPALVALFSQVPGAIICDRYASRLLVTRRYALLHRLFYLVIAFLPLLAPPGWRAVAFVFMVAAMNFPGTVAGVAWTALMGDLFPAHVRGRVFGERNTLTGFVTLICTLAGGVLLDRSERWFPWNYSAAYLVSFGALLLSYYYLGKLQEDPRRLGQTPDRPGVLRALRSFSQVIQNRPFVRFTLPIFVFHLGLNLPAAIYSILFVRILSLPAVWIGAFSVIFGLTGVLTYSWWGRLADRIGNRTVLNITLWLWPIFPILYAFVGGPWPIALLMAVGGVVGSGFNLTVFNSLLEVAPEDGRPNYVAVFNLANGLTGFAMPMLGVVIYRTWGLLAVMALATGVRLLGALFSRQARRNAFGDSTVGLV
ncbi:MAG: MFS transporter [Bacillota bacterium]